MIDDVNHLAKNSLSTTSAFSTSFKVVASVIIGAAIAYTAVKTYQYFHSKAQKTNKKEKSLILGEKKIVEIKHGLNISKKATQGKSYLQKASSYILP